VAPLPTNKNFDFNSVNKIDNEGGGGDRGGKRARCVHINLRRKKNEGKEDKGEKRNE